MAVLRRRPILSLPFLSVYFYSSSPCKPKPYSLPLLKPPAPKKIPFTATTHGNTWHDPYSWMSKTDDPDLIDYLNEENSYAAAFMADTGELRKRLLAEMKCRMPAKIITPPENWGDWLYYQYIPEGREYPILCRRRRHRGYVEIVSNYLRGIGEEKILLDWNELAKKFGYVHVGNCKLSPDHNYLAYTLDTTGSELFVLQVQDLRNGHIISNSGVEGVVSLAWAVDSSCLLYTVCDESLRPYRVYCTNLGSNVTHDLLFTENDMSCCVDITNTKDGKFITINSNTRASSEVYVLDATNLKDGLWPVRERVPGVQYFLEHHNGFFYILNNSPVGNMGSIDEGYHLARCRAEKSLLTSWQVVLLPEPEITFHDMDMFHRHLVLSIHKDGLPLFCSIDMPIDANLKKPAKVEELSPWFFPVPSSLCNIVPGSNQDFMSSIYRVVISSPVIPDIMVDYDMMQRKFTILHQEEVVGLTNKDKRNIPAKKFHSNPSGQFHSDKHLRSLEVSQEWCDLSEEFFCEKKEVVSHDGVKVPLIIFYSRNAHHCGQSPGLLHGYGAYGEVLDKSWSSDLLCLLNRGWVVAYADVRGGGDSTWHEAGTGLYKLNSMHDFAACGSYLINEGYVHKDRLGAIGISAGGLLIGASINLYPGLFCTAILKVPFLDICNTMLDPTLPLTILDYDEFGDPRSRTEFEMIRSYSPYDNIPSGFAIQQCWLHHRFMIQGLEFGKLLNGLQE